MPIPDMAMSLWSKLRAITMQNKLICCLSIFVWEGVGNVCTGDGEPMRTQTLLGESYSLVPNRFNFSQNFEHSLTSRIHIELEKISCSNKTSSGNAKMLSIGQPSIGPLWLWQQLGKEFQYHCVCVLLPYWGIKSSNRCVHVPQFLATMPIIPTITGTKL